MSAFNWINEFVCGVGIVMSLTWLFNKNWWFLGTQYLALYLLFFSIILLEQNLYWSTFFLEHPHFVLLSDPIALLLGPLLFFYVKRDIATKRYLFLHFIPVLVVIAAYTPIYGLPTAEKITFVMQTIWQGHDINAANFILFRIVLVGQIVGYGYVIQKREKFTWSLKRLLSKRIQLAQLLLASFFLYGVLRVIWLLFTLFSRYQYIALLDSGIRLITSLVILYLFVIVVNKIKIAQKGVVFYERSMLTNTDVYQLKERLNVFMQSDQPFLSKKLKMHDIASGLKISEHKLSQLLNVHLGINFFEYVNRYRIDHAKVLLIDPAYQKYTIEGIAGECGFNSKSTFNEAFKKIEGVTPSNFKKCNQHNETLKNS